MAQAKTLAPEQVKAVIERITSGSGRPLQDAIMFTASFRAGLRACELAGVKWKDVVDAGNVIVQPGRMWLVPNDISKGGNGRRIPMHPELYDALVAARAGMPPEATGPDKHLVLRTKRHTGEIDPSYVGCTPNAVRQYVKKHFNRAGLVGMTSHSGRRTFITTLARRANQHKCSLRDVQLMAGHKSILTTERYVDLSDGVSDLVGSL